MDISIFAYPADEEQFPTRCLFRQIKTAYLNMPLEQTLTSGNILKPRKALNKAFMKVKPNRSQIERFKENLIQLLDGTNEVE